jgi:hypothetical protein
MSRSVTLVLGGILVVIGLIWFFQGIGVLGGSVMSGVALWAVVGPIVALGGALLIVRAQRSKPE